MPVFEELVGGFRKHGLDDVLLLAGGVIPAEDQETLKRWGVQAIFGPGTTAEEAIELMRKHASGVRQEGR